MFWPKSSSSQQSPPPPGQRRSTGAGVTALPIRGTIRGPNNSSVTEHTRQEHLNSYLQDDTLKRSTRKVSSDDSTYDTVFQTTQGDTLILRVHWPDLNNPSLQPPPAMTLAGINARHPWLDTRMRIIGYDPIQTQQTWSNSRLLLGQAVHAIVKHLQLNPPEIIEITDAGLRAIQPKNNNNNNNTNNRGHNRTHTAPATSSSMNGSHQQPMTRHRQTQSASSSSPDAPPSYDTLLSVPEIDMPPIPSTFDQLNSLSRDQIDELMQDEMQFQLFCNKLPIIKTYHKVWSSVIDENATQANKNLQKQEQLETLHKQVKELQQQLKTQVAEFQKLEKKQDELCKPPDMKQVMKELNKAKQKAFSQSEKIAEDWLDDGCTENVDDFMKRFLEQRSIHHERAAKMELLKTKGINGRS